jgi:hypothetical protein
MKKIGGVRESVQSVEAELVRVVERLRAMKLGRYRCVMHDGSIVRIEIASWEKKIAEWLRKERPTEVTIAQVLDAAIGMDDAVRTRSHETRVAECLRRLDWTRGPRRRNRGGTGTSCVWRTPVARGVRGPKTGA